MITNTSMSLYVNPNTMQLTTDYKNAMFLGSDEERQELKHYLNSVNGFKLKPINDIGNGFFEPVASSGKTTLNRSANSVDFRIGASTTLNSGYTLTLVAGGFEIKSPPNLHGFNTKESQEASDINGALCLLLRYANGQFKPEDVGADKKKWTADALKGLEAFGIDVTKDFSVNGTKFHINEQGYIESQNSIDARTAYEIQRVNNGTYKFADETAKKWITYVSNYYTRNVPSEVKDAWMETLEETGINPFPYGQTSSLSQLALENEYATGGSNDIFGDSVESSKEAIYKILDRIGNPLGVVDEKTLSNEKTFYETLLKKLGNM